MNIKNFNMFENPIAKTRLCAISLAGILVMTSFSGCGKNTNTSKRNDSLTEIEYEHLEETKKTFDIGEHIISVPVNDPTLDIQQYEYHDGYKCVGLSSCANGSGYIFGGAHALYVNEYPVECYGTVNDKGLLLYDNFGTPLNFVKEENISNDTSKVFNTGEHIISVPIDNFTKNSSLQYQYYEGYEPIDIAHTSYGSIGSYNSGAIMYVNTEPVKCSATHYDEDGKTYYLAFGVPVELEKTRAK